MRALQDAMEELVDNRSGIYECSSQGQSHGAFETLGLRNAYAYRKFKSDQQTNTNESKDYLKWVCDQVESGKLTDLHVVASGRHVVTGDTIEVRAKQFYDFCKERNLHTQEAQGAEHEAEDETCECEPPTETGDALVDEFAQGNVWNFKSTYWKIFVTRLHGLRYVTPNDKEMEFKKIVFQIIDENPIKTSILLTLLPDKVLGELKSVVDDDKATQWVKDLRSEDARSTFKKTHPPVDYDVLYEDFKEWQKMIRENNKDNNKPKLEEDYRAYRLFLKENDVESYKEYRALPKADLDTSAAESDMENVLDELEQLCSESGSITDQNSSMMGDQLEEEKLSSPSSYAESKKQVDNASDLVQYQLQQLQKFDHNDEQVEFRGESKDDNQEFRVPSGPRSGPKPKKNSENTKLHKEMKAELRQLREQRKQWESQADTLHQLREQKKQWKSHASKLQKQLHDNESQESARSTQMIDNISKERDYHKNKHEKAKRAADLRRSASLNSHLQEIANLHKQVCDFTGRN